jgi:hypothetical protein
MKDKYTFRREFTDMYEQITTVEHTVEGDTLDEIMESFLYFLNGCSYSYVKDLIFVKEDGQEISVTDWDFHNKDNNPDQITFDDIIVGGDSDIFTISDLDGSLTSLEIDLENKSDPKK